MSPLMIVILFVFIPLFSFTFDKSIVDKYFLYCAFEFIILLSSNRTIERIESDNDLKRIFSKTEIKKCSQYLCIIDTKLDSLSK